VCKKLNIFWSNTKSLATPTKIQQKMWSSRRAPCSEFIFNAHYYGTCEVDKDMLIAIANDGEMFQCDVDNCTDFSKLRRLYMMRRGSTISKTPRRFEPDWVVRFRPAIIFYSGPFYEYEGEEQMEFVKFSTSEPFDLESFLKYKDAGIARGGRASRPFTATVADCIKCEKRMLSLDREISKNPDSKFLWVYSPVYASGGGGHKIHQNKCATPATFEAQFD
jgi:hypothetical protein